MKTFKLTTLFIALASTVLFSSCLSNNDNVDYPYYQSYVTIAGDASFGYTFYSDFGCKLIPTTASIEAVLPGLSKSKAKRALVAFDLVPETQNGITLERNQTYSIALGNYYNSNYALPTYETIDVNYDPEALDSLTTKNGNITSISKNDIWAVNGYINVPLTISYEYNKQFYLNTYFNSEEDFDLSTNTLYLNMYYNSNSDLTSNNGSSVFSFKLPENLSFASSDSINVVLRALINDKTELSEVGKCKVAPKDFYTPTY